MLFCSIKNSSSILLREKLRATFYSDCLNEITPDTAVPLNKHYHFHVTKNFSTTFFRFPISTYSVTQLSPICFFYPHCFFHSLLVSILFMSIFRSLKLLQLDTETDDGKYGMVEQNSASQRAFTCLSLCCRCRLQDAIDTHSQSHTVTPSYYIFQLEALSFA